MNFGFVIFFPPCFVENLRDFDDFFTKLNCVTQVTAILNCLFEYNMVNIRTDLANKDDIPVFTHCFVKLNSLTRTGS
jgi:hypothetical protein